MQNSGKGKIEAFNNVPNLINLLDRVGIGKPRKWWNDGMGWIAASNFYEFGEGVIYGLKDNLAFYLDSEHESYVQTLKLNMNRYRQASYEKSQNFLADKAKLLFEALQINPPDGLMEAIKTGSEYRGETETFIVSTGLDVGPSDAKADYYRLIIKTK